MTPNGDERLREAAALLRSIGLVDLHVDPILQHRLFGYDLRKRHRSGIRGQPLFWHTDIPRMLDAGYGGACLGVHAWPFERESGWREAMRQIDAIDELARDPRVLRVRHPDDWNRARQEGRLAVVPGVEGAHILNVRPDRILELADRGVAYLTLAHFSTNAYATCAGGRGANQRDGLSEAGRDLIGTLNRAGIAIDVSHVNHPGLLDACALTEAPVFATHTGVHGVHRCWRNIEDEAIDAIARTDGAIGIIFSPHFLAGRRSASSAAVVDHMEHIIRRVGERHVAIGTDFDGWLPAIPSDMRDCVDMPRLIAEMLRRAWSERRIAAICRDNALRVFREAWRARLDR